MKIKTIIPILLAALFFSACGEDFFETTVPIDVPAHTPALAITSQLLAGDSVISVYVSNSVGILENDAWNPITDATVELLKNGQPYVTLPYAGFNEKFYRLDLTEPFSSDPTEYELRVSAPGFEPVSAVQAMPTAVPILSLEYDPDGAINPDGDRVDEISVEFQDPAGVENFYKLEVWVDVDTFDYSYRLYLDNLEPLSENYNESIYLKDSSFDGKKFTWKVGTYDIYQEPGFTTKLRAVLINVTRDEYLFARSVSQSEEANDNPFAEPVIIHNNIEGGHGIFSLGTKSEEVIEL